MTTDHPAKPPEPLMTVRDVATLLKCGVATVWRNVQRGNLPQPVRFGGCTRWRRSDIEAITAQADKAA
jgi:predicted DNA-binding transcriptional regulator AlpA